jgi:outer membrane protein assembly factor BamB
MEVAMSDMKDEQFPAAGPEEPSALRPIRVWPAIVLVALFWAFWVAHYLAPLDPGIRFLSRMAAFGVLLLGFLIWWLSRRSISWRDRLLAIALWIAGTFVAERLADKTLASAFSMVLSSLPFVITGWVLWMWIARRRSAKVQRWGIAGVLLLSLGYFTLVRWDGLDANQFPHFNWRWSPTAEERFLAENGRASKAAATAESQWTLKPGDWPEFRGPNRDGVVKGIKVATDWQQNPPKEVWRHRVGPGWSSMILVDGHLVTQEQRGEAEAVVCYDAATGAEQWSHEDKSRFEESLAGAGPRGTPTFHNGRIYALGGKGVLNCLNAATGELVWSHDADAESKAGVPQWGYSISPLVVDDLVIVFLAGGAEGAAASKEQDADGNIAAYHADTGEQAWVHPTGAQSYSSPQLVALDGQRQVLMHQNHSLTAVDAKSGELSWERPETNAMALPMLQPRLVKNDELLVATDPGMVLLDLKQSDGKWTATDHWTSNRLKPAFNDVIVHEGHIFGLDDGILCCLELATGERLWKKGRYGGGQLLLLADQGDLLVLTEKGEVVLVPATAEKPEELGRFKAIEGKTWNHPVIAEGKLFVRNGEEMACFELETAMDGVAANTRAASPIIEQTGNSVAR